MLCNIITCILAGGEGTRLLPLTVHCAKPAVRFGGSYRLIDLTLSNCVNSDIRQMLVLPQYQAGSLEDHLRQGWSCLSQGRDAYVMSIPPPVGHGGYRGTADAVYQQLSLLERINPTHVLILGSDHVYQMDYRHLLQFHQERGADVTVATFPVPRHQASQFGVVTVDPTGEVISFLEKSTHESPLLSRVPAVLASMGIYLFRFAVLREVLGEDAQRRSTHDLGREILPGMLGRYRVAAFPFVAGIAKAPAYWRDVGTIDAYWEAHMDLLGPHARFQLSLPQWPLRATPAQGPPITFGSPGDLGAGQVGGVTNSIIAQGCQLQGGCVDRAILSPGVWIEAEAEVQESILCDGVHIGRGAQVRRAILDHGSVVPPGARIGFDLAADGEQFTVSDGGITVVGYAPMARALASL
ncbi:MAG: sugar phosphate nucleotidyltransferase [Candidatus Entotheonellia bacterium]